MSVASKGFRYARTGPIASVLKLENFNAATLNPEKDVVIKMTHAPLHRTDAAVINGSGIGRQTLTQSSAAISCKVAPFPRTAGHEGLGVVVEAGRNARVKSGDHVWISPTAGVGTWATHIAANGEHVHALPSGFSKSQASLAACATALITGEQVVSRDYGKINAGDVVLVNGGSSLAALVATAAAKRAGATVVGAALPGARFEAAKSRLKAAGAAEVVEYTPKGARAAAAAAQGKRIALFANGVGGPAFNDFFRLLSQDGGCVTYGAQSGFGLMWSGGHQIFNGTSMAGFFAPRFLSKLSYEERQRVLEAALAHASVSYPVEAVSSLDSVTAAWDNMYLSGGKKYVLTF